MSNLTPKQFEEWKNNNEQKAKEKKAKEQTERAAIIKKYIPKKRKK